MKRVFFSSPFLLSSSLNVYPLPYKCWFTNIFASPYRVKTKYLFNFLFKVLTNILQLFGNNLFIQLQYFFQRNPEILISLGKERDGSSLIPRSACPAYSVNIVLHIRGTFEIDYQNYILYIETARADTCGNQDIPFA